MDGNHPHWAVLRDEGPYYYRMAHAPNFHEEREKMNEDIALEQMPLIDDRGWLEAAEAAVDGGESAFESLEVLSISMAECLCSILS